MGCPTHFTQAKLNGNYCPGSQTPSMMLEVLLMGLVNCQRMQPISNLSAWWYVSPLTMWTQYRFDIGCILWQFTSPINKTSSITLRVSLRSWWVFFLLLLIVCMLTPERAHQYYRSPQLLWHCSLMNSLEQLWAIGAVGCINIIVEYAPGIVGVCSRVFPVNSQ